MFRTEREVDYSYNFYKNPHEEIVECKKKNEYNPYVNNSGTVLGNYITIFFNTTPLKLKKSPNYFL